MRQINKALTKQRKISSLKWEQLASPKHRKKTKKEVPKSGFYLAKISYDLRTPLNVIIGFSELLRHEKAGSLNQEQREYLNDIIVSAKELLHLIKKTTEHPQKRKIKN